MGALRLPWVLLGENHPPFSLLLSPLEFGAPNPPTLDANRYLGASCLEGAALCPSEACLCGDAWGRLTVLGCWGVKPSPQVSWEL